MRAVLRNHGLKEWIFLAGLILFAVPTLARAQPYETPDTWGGDLWSSPRLTGNWGGVRDDLAKMYWTSICLRPPRT
jgi:hypothetical protein